MNEGDMYPIFQGKCKIKKSTRANDKKILLIKLN